MVNYDTIVLLAKAIMGGAGCACLSLPMAIVAVMVLGVAGLVRGNAMLDHAARFERRTPRLRRQNHTSRQ